MIKLMCWNIRGIANQASFCRLFKLSRMPNLSIIVLLEPFFSAARVDEIRPRLGF